MRPPITRLLAAEELLKNVVVSVAKDLQFIKQLPRSLVVLQ
jgi:hypothetical protein